MAQFKSTRLSTLPSIIEPLSESAKFWRRSLNAAKVAKELHAINCVDIDVAHNLLVSSMSRIAIYEYYSLEVKRSFTTPSFAHLFGAHYRPDDGKLLVAGSADGVVRVWDPNNSKPLRCLGDKRKEWRHSAAVHRTHFVGTSKVVSLGDDRCIKLWDITEESLLSSIGGENSAHSDYIRASHVNTGLSLVISGSYDKSVKIWDMRSPQTAVNNLSHGSPVEAITVRDLCVISAGGDTINVFDLIAGKVMKTFVKTHHKTITCAYNHGSYLITGSIDGHLKVYDSDFNVAASLTYSPAQLLSCAFDDKILAVGANDGIFSVNKFRVKSGDIERAKNMGSKTRYFNYESVDDSLWRNVDETRNVKRRTDIDNDDTIRVENKWDKDGKKLAKYDMLLKEFNYTLALNRVLEFNGESPEVVVSFMQELIRRGGIKIALAGRQDKDLKLVMDFLLKHIRDPRFSRILVDVALILTDIYLPQINRSPNIKALFIKLNAIISNEINCMQQMLEISGQISSLINCKIK